MWSEDYSLCSTQQLFNTHLCCAKYNVYTGWSNIDYHNVCCEFLFLEWIYYYASYMLLSSCTTVLPSVPGSFHSTFLFPQDTPLVPSCWASYIAKFAISSMEISVFTPSSFSKTIPWQSENYHTIKIYCRIFFCIGLSWARMSQEWHVVQNLPPESWKDAEMPSLLYLLVFSPFSSANHFVFMSPLDLCRLFSFLCVDFVDFLSALVDETSFPFFHYRKIVT